MDSLLADVSEATGKSIDIREMSMLGTWGAAALWMDLGDRHLILESAPTSSHHRAWVRAHEFGHIVYAHLGWADPPAHARTFAEAGQLLDAARQHSVDFRRPAEQAAEAFARYADLRIREAHGGGHDNDYTAALS